MENGYGLYSRGSSGWSSMRNEEFQEEDVWGVLKELRKDPNSREMKSCSREPYCIPKRLQTATRTIPQSSNKNPSSQEPKIVGRSAPINIPDWSKIYGTTSKGSCSWLDDDGSDGGFARSCWGSEKEDEENGEGDMVPPHEWIARRLARSQTSSFSVCEGAGRTLKGRDLSRVRNAVLTRTGFLESESNY